MYAKFGLGGDEVGGLSLAPFERVLKHAGAKRVSQGALEEFAKVMEEKIFKISQEAVALAKHAGRKTILAEDVRMARRRLNL